MIEPADAVYDELQALDAQHDVVHELRHGLSGGRHRRMRPGGLGLWRERRGAEAAVRRLHARIDQPRASGASSCSRRASAVARALAIAAAREPAGRDRRHAGQLRRRRRQQHHRHAARAAGRRGRAALPRAGRARPDVRPAAAAAAHAAGVGAQLDARARRRGADLQRRSPATRRWQATLHGARAQRRPRSC